MCVCVPDGIFSRDCDIPPAELLEAVREETGGGDLDNHEDAEGAGLASLLLRLIRFKALSLSWGLSPFSFSCSMVF